MGFSDFYKLDWLQSILTWQDQEVGCFGKEGELNHVKYTLKNILILMNGLNDLLNCQLQYCFSPSEDISQIFEEFLDAPHKRVKRREKTLTGVSLLLTMQSLIKMKNYFINMTQLYCLKLTRICFFS